MHWLWYVLAAWALLAVPAAVVFGRALRRARRVAELAALADDLDGSRAEGVPGDGGADRRAG